MFKSIVAAVDGSKLGDSVVRKSADIAALCGARLILAHIADPARANDDLDQLASAEHMDSPEPEQRHASLARVPGWFDDALSGAQGTPSMREVLEDLGRQILANADVIAHRAGATDTHQVLEDGDPALRLLEISAREEADLIVVGARGLGRIQEILLGSVSHKVAMKSACPCLIVK